MILNLPNEYKSELNYAIKAAESLGIKIYLIGGIVRDLVLGKEIKDIDITVQGNAIDFCNTKLDNLTDCEIIGVQENLKTAKVKFKSGVVIDFASTREEYYRKGGELPVAYNFGCELEKDIKRRDFTINTLALSLTGSDKYSVIDYFNGYEDIKNKKIKILHDKSFTDDPSRIIRAIKFEMRFDFEIEEKTFNLMTNYLENVDNTIPLERIKNELKQYFSINKKGLYKNLTEKKVYKLLCNNPFLNFEETYFDRIKKYVENEDYWLIYITLLLINSDIDNPRLNLKSEEKKVIKETKDILQNMPLDNNFKIYNAFNKKHELLPVIYYVISHDEAVIKFYNELKGIKVLINGDDLIQLGFKPSPYFGELFEKVLKEKLVGKITTKKEEIEFVSKFIV